MGSAKDGSNPIPTITPRNDADVAIVKNAPKLDLDALWNMDAIRKVPFDVQVISTRTDSGYRIDQMYYSSEQTPHGPNRIFCCFARPINPTKPVPVLLMGHGSGCTTDAATTLWWAQATESAALYIDWSGEFGTPAEANYTKWINDYPNPYENTYRMTPTIRDSSMYHILMAFRRGLDYLAQQPNVDASRTMFWGASYGGYDGLLLAGIDPRVKCVFAAGGGGAWEGSNSALNDNLKKLPPDLHRDWYAAFDPINYVSRTHASILITTCTDDWFFWLGGTQKNILALSGDKCLLTTPNSDHGVGGPKSPDVWQAWLKHYCDNEPTFSQVVPGSLIAQGATYSWSVQGSRPITSASLQWSPGKVVWPGRYWLVIPAAFVTVNGRPQYQPLTPAWRGKST